MFIVVFENRERAQCLLKPTASSFHVLGGLPLCCVAIESRPFSADLDSTLELVM